MMTIPADSTPQEPASVQIYDPNSSRIRTVRNLRRKLFDEGQFVLFDVVTKSGSTYELFMSEADFTKHNPDVSY